MHTASTQPAERTAARKLVKAILATGATVTVYNGGDDADLERSTDEKDILDNIGETGMDNLVCRQADGYRLGTFALVWGNAEDGSELIADHSDNGWCDGIVGTLKAS